MLIGKWRSGKQLVEQELIIIVLFVFYDNFSMGSQYIEYLLLKLGLNSATDVISFAYNFGKIF